MNLIDLDIHCASLVASITGWFSWVAYNGGE